MLVASRAVRSAQLWLLVWPWRYSTPPSPPAMPPAASKVVELSARRLRAQPVGMTIASNAVVCCASTMEKELGLVSIVPLPKQVSRPDARAA